MRNRAEIAKDFLERFGFVTNRMFDEVGLTHTGRNAVAEVKAYFKAKGFDIKFKGSKNFLENRWTLVRAQGQHLQISVDQNGQTAFA